ncbi:MAG: hypothetical protein Q8K36_03645, partial [Alphaproteobacteria bacterium]|nr:hypothetical protein [Alphaproteobacteria bacterium]
MIQIQRLAKTPVSKPVFLVKVFGIMLDAVYFHENRLGQDSVFVNWRKSLVRSYLKFVKQQKVRSLQPLSMSTLDVNLASLKYLNKARKTILTHIIFHMPNSQKKIRFLKIMAKAGCEDAQEYLVNGCNFGFNGLRSNKLWVWKFASMGYKRAQELYMGYNFDCSFRGGIDLVPIEELAKIGWRCAQDYLAGYYSWDAPDPKKLLELAEQGYPNAQEYVVMGYANESYGFKKSFAKVLELANKGWPAARKHICDQNLPSIFNRAPYKREIFKYAKEGCHAARLTISKFLDGNGDETNATFLENRAKLFTLADCGWEEAQEILSVNKWE